MLLSEKEKQITNKAIMHNKIKNKKIMNTQKNLNPEQKNGWKLVINIIIYALTAIGSFIAGGSL